MVIKCKTCAGTITYDGVSSRLVCNYCGSTYTKYDYAAEIEANLQEMQKKELEEATSEQEETEYHVFTCSECGAEVISHKNEVSTFCGFCGQNTIVFSHMAAKKMPDFIIPFKTTREQAVEAIHDVVNKGKYIPKNFKSFEPERVVGIYIPYYLYSCTYDDLQKREALSSFMSDHSFGVHATMHMEFVTVDAAKNFNNKAAEWIEPFYFDQAVGFDPTYLIGYFADIEDESADNLEVRSNYRLRNIYNAEVNKKYPGKVVSSSPLVSKPEVNTVMLPVWMMTTEFKGKKHVFMVNGQTGSAIGALSFDKPKVALTALLLALVTIPLSFVVAMIFFYFMQKLELPFIVPSIVLSFFVGFIFKKASANYREYKECMNIVQDINSQNMVNSRREDK